MKIIELIGVVVIVGSVIGFLFVEDGVNQARMNELSVKYQGQVKSLFNQTINNMTQLTLSHQNELSLKQAEIDSKNSLIITLNNEKAVMQTTINTLNLRINSTNGTSQYLEEKIEDLQEELNETKSHILKNVSLYNVTTFITNDTTDTHLYHEPFDQDHYVCTHFARDLKYNASLIGYRSAFVALYLHNNVTTNISSHAIVAFNTTDHGLVFIEPQTDAIAYNLTKNVSYPFLDNETIYDLVYIW